MMKRIALDAIYPNPDQPRKTFELDKLRELAASIKANGLKQPITVRPDDAGKFMIVMGERRYRAHLLLQEAGDAADVLCHISKVDDEQLSIDAIIENDQRVDVAPLEQARSYQRMIDEFGYDVRSLADKLGKPPYRVTERLQLLRLSATNQHLLERGQITPTQAYYLAEVDEGAQARLAKLINAGSLPTTSSLKSAVEAFKAEAAQVGMFGDGDQPPPPSEQEVKHARGFEHKVEQIAAMLRAGIDDNTIVAVKKVNPDRAGTLADLLRAAQADMKRIEDALRVVAALQAEPLEEAA